MNSRVVILSAFFLICLSLSTAAYYATTEEAILDMMYRINFILCDIYHVALVSSVSISAFLIIWAGATYMIADDPEKTERLKRIIYYSLIGLVGIIVVCPVVNYLVTDTEITPFEETCNCYSLERITTSTTSTSTTTSSTTSSSTTSSTLAHPLTHKVVFDTSWLRFKGGPDSQGPGVCDNSRYALNIAKYLDGGNKRILIYAAEDYNLDHFDGLKNLFQGEGYTVDVLGRPGSSITSGLLSAYGQAWFIDNSYYAPTPLSSSELDAIKSFYHNGGGILLSGEDCEIECYVYLVGEIASVFDVVMGRTLNTSTYVDSDGCIPPTFTSHEIGDSVGRISTSSTDVLLSTTNPDVQTIASIGGKSCVMVLEGTTTTTTTSTTSSSTTTSSTSSSSTSSSSTSSTTTTTIDPSCIPVYNPGKWNNDDRSLYCNNCYAYGNDKKTYDFPQPGYAHNHNLNRNFPCSDVITAAEKDGLEYIGLTDGDCTGCRHKVALVTDPGTDYHWYRQHIDGYWSHKPGSTPAKDTDNSGRKISSPETADRGGYTSFCGYFCVDTTKVTIAGWSSCDY